MNLIRQYKIDIPDSGRIMHYEFVIAHFPKLKEYLIKELNYDAEAAGIII